MQWLGDKLNATLKEMHAAGQVWLQGASGMEHALHTAGLRDHAVGRIPGLEAAPLQETHHRADQLCAMAS